MDVPLVSSSMCKTTSPHVRCRVLKGGARAHTHMNPHYHTLSLHYPNLPKYLLDSTDLYHFMTFYDMFNLFIACHSRLPWPAIFCCPSLLSHEGRRQLHPESHGAAPGKGNHPQRPASARGSYIRRSNRSFSKEGLGPLGTWALLRWHDGCVGSMMIFHQKPWAIGRWALVGLCCTTKSPPCSAKSTPCVSCQPLIQPISPQCSLSHSLWRSCHQWPSSGSQRVHLMGTTRREKQQREKQWQIWQNWAGIKNPPSGISWNIHGNLFSAEIPTKYQIAVSIPMRKI